MGKHINCCTDMVMVMVMVATSLSRRIWALVVAGAAAAACDP